MNAMQMQDGTVAVFQNAKVGDDIKVDTADERYGINDVSNWRVIEIVSQPKPGVTIVKAERIEDAATTTESIKSSHGDNDPLSRPWYLMDDE